MMSYRATRTAAICLPLFLAATLIGCDVLRQPQPAAATPALMQGSTWRYSTDNGRTFADHLVIPAGATGVKILATSEFTAPAVSDVEAWQVTHNIPSGQAAVLINQKAAEGPMPGMRYQTIVSMDRSLVRPGRNRVQVQTEVNNPLPKTGTGKELPFAIQMSVRPLTSADLKIRSGPVLGAVEKGSYTVTVRTNLPASAHVESSTSGTVKVVAESTAPALLHRLSVPVNSPADVQHMLVVARNGQERRELITVPVLARGIQGKLRFVAMGDSRTNPNDWRQVAEAAASARPAFVVFGGDMIALGTRDWEWDSDFFSPGARLFSTVPFYAVIGNHESNAPLFNEIFVTPGGDGRSRNWSQTVGDVLLIGIDPRGNGDKDRGMDLAWLEKTLSESRAKFIFLTSHYPAWTSGNHGKLKDGKPIELAVREGQERIMPLLEKYKATAMLAGHDHVYERSEPPAGVCHIITGGAGAPRYGKVEQAQLQNPHSKVFASELHYCLFEVDGNTCTMQAITPDGRVIDTRTFKAREVAPTGQ